MSNVDRWRARLNAFQQRETYLAGSKKGHVVDDVTAADVYENYLLWFQCLMESQDSNYVYSCAAKRANLFEKGMDYS